jgi:Glycosyltransferase
MTHPTQYHAPWFRALAKRPEISLHVFYGFQPSAELQGKDFGLDFEWDTPLLDGYPHTFLKNVATKPGWGFRDTDTPELRDLIPRSDYDAWVINGWTTKSEWLAIRTCWKSNTPMLVRGDSTLIDKRPVTTRVAKRVLLGRWIPRFSRYLTVGTLNESYYEHYGADRERFVPVRHFVDNAWFAQHAKSRRENARQLRASWGIAENAVVFLFAGKLMKKKRPADAVEALRIARAKAPNLHLLIAGDGELRAECERLTREADLPVTFTGFLNQSAMPDAYAASDVLILPSAYQETWGLVVNEAMASGLPAIVSDKVGCAPDLIVQGETGYTFPAGDVRALAGRMTAYATSTAEARRQGLCASDRIRSFSLEAATENTVRAIKDACSK